MKHKPAVEVRAHTRAHPTTSPESKVSPHVIDLLDGGNHGGIDNAVEHSQNPQGNSSAYAWKKEPNYNHARHIPDSKLDGGKVSGQ